MNKSEINKEIISWLKSFLFAAGIAFIFHTFIFTPVKVHGESMMPTFTDENRLVVSKLSKIQHFDIVVFDAPDSDEKYIKRVIGMPGDTIKVKNDVLYINGKKFDEPYLKANKEKIPGNATLTEDFTLKNYTGEYKVPAGKLFVMGDNRLYSNDSRIFGFIPMDSVIGEAKFQFYPLNQLGTHFK
ncbi:signal peptidase I [Peribacillus glennii]|uniref:Signal peptidase I n=1 Tax=Peribacillus glennii TaxID=2303991 RepID=A0A372L7A5_9BACI|nr:signal peptidase I [Peribacillus glennii]RFU60758.1 signal peptidase I [Peribacillus glennii]